MATKNITNFVVDHVIRGIMTKRNGDYLWSINEVENPSLNVTLSDTSQAVNALGAVIQEFDRGREAEFSAESSLWDLNLYAAQLGKDKEVASVDATIITPAFEEIAVKGIADETYVLKNIPTATTVPTTIYLMNGDGTLGTSYKAATTASATEFVYATDTHTITLPTGLKAGDVLFVMYEYEATDAVAVTADGVNFPKAGKFYLEVLGTDVCDPDVLIHAYLVSDSAKLDGNVDYSFTTDGKHPFTIRFMQSYCDKEKKLFKIIIPNED